MLGVQKKIPCGVMHDLYMVGVGRLLVGLVVVGLD